MEQLSTRALNRALLARQMLLQRATFSVVDAVTHLGGLQAQQARPPFTGLWSRLEAFKKQDLLDLLRSRQVLRATTLRGTLHLITLQDFQAWRPLLQPMLTAGAQSILRERLQTFDHAAVLAHATKVFTVKPHTFTELRNKLVAAFPGVDERAMGYFVRTHLPLASVPDEKAPWCFGSDAEFDLMAGGTAGTPVALITRYLTAFGPASIADFQSWSGLKSVKPWFEGMPLSTFQDARKRVLYDLPEAPRPDPETPAPVRFIAEFDNLVLGHADRSRIVADEHRPRIVTKNLLVLGTFLVDGFVAGTWKHDGKNVKIEPFETLPGKAMKLVDAEANQLAQFLCSG